MDERLRFVAQLLAGEKTASLCREFRISRVTRYKIQERQKTGGREALERVRAGACFDVIRCDLIMPERTGAQLFDELQTVDPGEAKRMVSVTSGAFTEESKEFLERLPDPRLQKPVDPGELEEAIAATTLTQSP